VIIIAAIVGLWIVSAASLAMTLPPEFWTGATGERKPDRPQRQTNPSDDGLFY